MSRRAELSSVFPLMLAHEGVWRGTYRHFDADGRLLERHYSEIVCEFPDEGDWHYVQHNYYRWENGREFRSVLPSVLKDGRLFWDVETFCGYAWESGPFILLEVERRDDPRASFLEMITLAPGGERRARTWHWFKNGRLIKRTLCDEERVAPVPSA